MEKENRAWTMLELATLDSLVGSASMNKMLEVLKGREEADIVRHIMYYPGMKRRWSDGGRTQYNDYKTNPSCIRINQGGSADVGN